jgi:hypothetical protein
LGSDFQTCGGPSEALETFDIVTVTSPATTNRWLDPSRPGKGDDDVLIRIVVLICETTDDECGGILVASRTITASSAEHCDRKRKKDDESGDVFAHFLGRLSREEFNDFHHGLLSMFTLQRSRVWASLDFRPTRHLSGAQFRNGRFLAVAVAVFAVAAGKRSRHGDDLSANERRIDPSRLA